MDEDEPSWDLFSFLREEDEQYHTLLHFALSPPPPPPPSPSPTLSQLRSAFSTCSRVGSRDGGLAVGPHVVSAAVNIYRRLFGFLRRIGEGGAAAAEALRAPAEEEGARGAGRGQGRGFQHMMRERLRRERMSQGYADLHAMLSSSSKGDKNSVVKAAAAHVRELKYRMEQLQRRNAELSVVAVALQPPTAAAAAAIYLTIANCSTSLVAIDALTAALRCLKLMGLKITAVRSSFSGQDLWVVVGLETKVDDAAQVGKTMTITLMDAQKKFCTPNSTQQSKWGITCHVENVT